MLMTLTAEMTNEERKQKRREMAYPQIIAICKANGVEPREWFKDVIRRIPEYENGRSDITHLLPRTGSATPMTAINVNDFV